MENVEDDLGLAEPEHLEEMFTALGDTVAGTEGMALTNAQEYAFQVLKSAGLIQPRDQVAGQEGFFESVGNGAKAVWAYIQKMIAAIWNFFFGGGKNGVESIEKKTEETLKEGRQQLQAVAAAQVLNAEKVKANFQHNQNVVEQLLKDFKQMSDDHNGVQQLKAVLDEAKDKSPAEQAKAIREVAPKLAKMNSRGQKAFHDLCGRASEQLGKFNELVKDDHASHFNGTAYAKLWKEFHSKIGVFTKIQQNFDVLTGRKIESIQDGLACEEALNNILTEMRGARTVISGAKTEITTLIKALQAKMDEQNLHKDPVFNKDLTACKIFLSATTSMIKQLQNTYDYIERCSGFLLKLFGIRP